MSSVVDTADPLGEEPPVASITKKYAVGRERSIRLAVITSMVSKSGTILLQLVSIPIAVRVLGREEFGCYTMVNLALSVMSMFQVGVGPALAHGLAAARSQGDAAKENTLVSSAFFLMVGLALVAGLLFAGILYFIPLPVLFGGKIAGNEHMLGSALWTGLGLFLLIFVLNLTERVREGRLEVAGNNLWGAAGNVLAAIAVGVGVRFIPEVWFLVLAMHGSLVIAKLGNTISLWRKAPSVIPTVSSFRAVVARNLFTDGLSFSVCCIVPVLVEYNLCGQIVGRGAGPGMIALYGVFISMTVMQLGFIVMLSAPTWPAVADALARGDVEWARKAAFRLYFLGMAFAVFSGTGLVFLGPRVLHVWLGEEFNHIAHVTLACYAFYFLAHVWRHLNHTMMIGTGQVAKLMPVQIAESAMILGVAWFVFPRWGLDGMLAVMGAVIFSLTGTLLPWRVFRRLKSGN